MGKTAEGRARTKSCRERERAREEDSRDGDPLHVAPLAQPRPPLPPHNLHTIDPSLFASHIERNGSLQQVRRPRLGHLAPVRREESSTAQQQERELTSPPPAGSSIGALIAASTAAPAACARPSSDPGVRGRRSALTLAQARASVVVVERGRRGGTPPPLSSLLSPRPPTHHLPHHQPTGRPSSSAPRLSRAAAR